jgi:predicted XRE-type DNA-binding protein
MTEAGFDSVWDVLENAPAEAAAMKARSGLMTAIRDAVECWQLTQAVLWNGLPVPSSTHERSDMRDQHQLAHPHVASLTRDSLTNSLKKLPKACSLLKTTFV